MRREPFGDEITSEQKAASHVLNESGVALGHHGGVLEGRLGYLSELQLLEVFLFHRVDVIVGRQHEADSGFGNEVGLEFGDVDVESTF